MGGGCLPQSFVHSVKNLPLEAGRILMNTQTAHFFNIKIHLFNFKILFKKTLDCLLFRLIYSHSKVNAL